VSAQPVLIERRDRASGPAHQDRANRKPGAAPAESCLAGQDRAPGSSTGHERREPTERPTRIAPAAQQPYSGPAAHQDRASGPAALQWGQQPTRIAPAAHSGPPAPHGSSQPHRHRHHRDRASGTGTTGIELQDFDFGRNLAASCLSISVKPIACPLWL
jgi:hypothetical protein